MLIVTAVVAGAGLVAQPSYDAVDRPQLAVDDLRNLPTEEVWQTDLSSATTLGTPSDCVGWSRVGTVDGDALLEASTVTLSDRCGGSGGRLARVDLETGRVVWGANVAAALGRAVDWVEVAPDDDGRWASLVVQDEPGSTLARLDLRTGEVIDRSSAVATDDPLEVSTVQGRSSTTVLVSHQPRSRFDADGSGPMTDDGDLTRYELRRLDDLGTVVWQGDEPSQATVTLIDDDLYVVTASGDGPRVIDSTTGQVHPLPVESDSYGWPTAQGDHVYVPFARPEGQRLVAFSRDAPGTTDWAVDLAGDDSVAFSDRCVTVTSAPTGADLVVAGRTADGDVGDADAVGRAAVTCRSPDTGRVVWSASVPVPAGQQVQSSWLGAEVDLPFDEVVVTVSPTNDWSDDETSTITLLDAGDGHVTFSAALAGYSMPLAFGRTTVDAMTYGADGHPTLVVLDRAGGRELWRSTFDDARAVEFWGPHVVVTGQDGVVRRLDDGTEVVDAGAVGTG